MFDCVLCNKNFASKFSLNRHVKSCKGKIEKYVCLYCPNTYTSEKYFLAHKIKCEEKQMNNDKLRENFIEELKENIDVLKNALVEEKKQEKNTFININVNNVNIQANFIIKGNIVFPLDLSQSRFDRIVDNNYTYKVYEKNTVVRDVIIPYLSTDDGKPSAVITDKSRMTIKCVDMNNKLVTHDPKTIIGMCVSSKPLEEKHSIYEERYTKDIYGNPINTFVNDATHKTEMITKHHIMKKKLYNYSNRLLQKKPKEIVEANIKFIEE
jgi:hypothetical protein